jgi:hypothetical protein
MGGTESKASIKVVDNKLIINQNDVNVLSETLNEQISNTIVENAKNCSANIDQLQNIRIRNRNVMGDVNISDVNQAQTAALTFECINADAVKNEIANNLAAQMTNSIENTTTQDILTKLAAAAESETTKGLALPTGSTSSETNVDMFANYESVTKNNTNIENVIKNKIQNNFFSKNVSNCISSVNNTQNMDFENVNVMGNVNAKALNQTQAADLMAKCVNEANIGGAIVNSVVGALGIEQRNTSSVRATSDITATAKATTKNDMLSFISDIAAAIGGGQTMSIVCVIVCALVLLVIIYFGFQAFMGDSEASSEIRGKFLKRK